MIQIHLPDEYPMGRNFDNIQTGTEATYRVQYQRIHRVNTPAASCSKNLHNSTVLYRSLIVSKKDGSLLSGKFRYRSEDCRMEALVIDAQTKCNCSLFELPVNNDLPQLAFCHDLSRIPTLSECLSSVKQCIRQTNWMKAATKAASQWENCTHPIHRLRWKSMKICENDCDVEGYKSKLSLKSIPGTKNEFFFENIFRQSSISAYQHWENIAKSHPIEKYLERSYYKTHYIPFPNIRHNNIVRILVLPHRRPVLLVKESPTYGLSSLFAKIGGLLGLYLGVSILTLAELLQLAGQCVHWMLTTVSKITRKTPAVALWFVGPVFLWLVLLWLPHKFFI